MTATLLDREPDELRAAIAEARAAGDLKALRTLLNALRAALTWKPQEYQLAPPGEWWTWAFQAGRGTGKSDAGAHWFDEHMKGPACDKRVPGGHKGILIGPTHAACVAGTWNPPHGLSAHNPDVVKVGRKGGTYVVWPNGAEAFMAGAHTEQDAEQIRAHAANTCCWWIDEGAIARHLKVAVDNLALGARLGKRPHGIATSTPKPTPGWKHLVSMPGVVVTRASSYDNVYLPAAYRHTIAQFEGTRYGAMEIHGELIDDFPGALWNRDVIDAHRKTEFPGDRLERVRHFACARISEGIDPSTWDPDLGDDPGTVGEGLETGIVIVGMDDQDPPHLYVFEDASLRARPEEWGRAVVTEYDRWGVSIVVPETNVGALAVSTVRSIRQTIGWYRDGKRIGVRAKQGKRVRAEPVSALYELGRVHHVGEFPALEAQMCTWDPTENWSPDRIDALVYAILALDPWRRRKATVSTAADAII